MRWGCPEQNVVVKMEWVERWEEGDREGTKVYTSMNDGQYHDAKIGSPRKRGEDSRRSTIRKDNRS